MCPGRLDEEEEEEEGRKPPEFGVRFPLAGNVRMQMRVLVLQTCLSAAEKPTPQTERTEGTERHVRDASGRLISSLCYRLARFM